MSLCMQVFFLPVTPEFVEQVIRREKPDGIVISMGGQTALNCAVQLFEAGILEKYNVKVIKATIVLPCRVCIIASTTLLFFISSFHCDGLFVVMCVVGCFRRRFFFVSFLLSWLLFCVSSTCDSGWGPWPGLTVTGLSYFCRRGK